MDWRSLGWDKDRESDGRGHFWLCTAFPVILTFQGNQYDTEAERGSKWSFDLLVCWAVVYAMGLMAQSWALFLLSPAIRPFLITVSDLCRDDDRGMRLRGRDCPSEKLSCKDSFCSSQLSHVCVSLALSSHATRSQLTFKFVYFQVCKIWFSSMVQFF